jgi:hypothetical protein
MEPSILAASRPAPFPPPMSPVIRVQLSWPSGPQGEQAPWIVDVDERAALDALAGLGWPREWPADEQGRYEMALGLSQALCAVFSGSMSHEGDVWRAARSVLFAGGAPDADPWLSLWAKSPSEPPVFGLQASLHAPSRRDEPEAARRARLAQALGESLRALFGPAARLAQEPSDPDGAVFARALAGETAGRDAEPDLVQACEGKRPFSLGVILMGVSEESSDSVLGSALWLPHEGARRFSRDAAFARTLHHAYWGPLFVAMEALRGAGCLASATGYTLAPVSWMRGAAERMPEQTMPFYMLSLPGERRSGIGAQNGWPEAPAARRWERLEASLAERFGAERLPESLSAQARAETAGNSPGQLPFAFRDRLHALAARWSAARQEAFAIGEAVERAPAAEPGSGASASEPQAPASLPRRPARAL